MWECRPRVNYLLCCGQDPDLKALRDRREWLDAVEKARGGVSGKAYANARAESKSPFRLIRLLTFGGLGAGAGIGLAIIIGRLLSALKGLLACSCVSRLAKLGSRDCMPYCATGAH